MTPRMLRYGDLVEAGIVSNRATLYRWIKQEGFPAGQLIGPNSRGWPEDEVTAWVCSRPRGLPDPREREEAGHD